jgi:PAS domain S-box-containing protein
VEHLFQVPVAYVALADSVSQVASRIGSGSEYWPLLRTYPVALGLDGPMVMRDAGPSDGSLGDLRFAASAPLITSGGVSLGVLVIADRQPRPDFSERDVEALSDIATTVAAKMELRLIASHLRESELALHQAERRFRDIADSAPLPIICSGADGASSFVNKAWLDFTGRGLAEELADGGFGCVHPDSRRIVYETYWRAFQAREPVSVDFPLRRHDGQYRRMLCRGVPRFREDGPFAGFVATLVDLTSQDEALAEVQKQSLCAAAVANAAGFLYLLLDTQGRIEQTSPGCMLGGEAQIALGALLWETRIAARHGSEAIRAAIQRSLATRTAVQLQTASASPDGERELSWTVTPIIGPAGDLLAVVVTASAGSLTREVVHAARKRWLARAAPLSTGIQAQSRGHQVP